MKKTTVFSVAILAVLWASSMALAGGKATEKRQGRQRKVSAEQTAWLEKLKTMTPEQQQVAKAKKSFETAVAPWRKIRLLAAQEKATKTVAAIDQIIAAKEKQLNRKLAGLQKPKAGPKKEPKAQTNKKTERKGRGKKKTGDN
jgi:hypothetical protein